jgi:hypothetical protein
MKNSNKIKLFKIKSWLINLPKKYLWCSWKHHKHRCYPEVWKEDNGNWHCDKCWPCYMDLEFLLLVYSKKDIGNENKDKGP